MRRLLTAANRFSTDFFAPAFPFFQFQPTVALKQVFAVALVAFFQGEDIDRTENNFSL